MLPRSARLLGPMPHPRSLSPRLELQNSEPHVAKELAGGHAADSSLIPISRLPAQLRACFSYTHFNRVQSACLALAFFSDENLLISAPTGSGKTGAWLAGTT
mgnify:CR=1 FL=1